MIVVGLNHRTVPVGLLERMAVPEARLAKALAIGELPLRELRQQLGRGPIATPDYLQWAPSLPKTRSGKIMRRILRKIAENDFGNLGDTSTLADPGVVEDLVKNRAK